MLQTYSAILENNQLRWTHEKPALENEGNPVSVLVTIMDEVSASHVAAKKEKLAQVLDRIAERNVLAEIADPVLWQQEIRADRDLPGRE